jgi:hypothetical protein
LMTEGQVTHPDELITAVLALTEGGSLPDLDPLIRRLPTKALPNPVGWISVAHPP